jgi:hypothetical protein
MPLYEPEGKNDSIVSTDYYDIAAMSPAGSINSSVNDMSKWLITLMMVNIMIRNNTRTLFKRSFKILKWL